MKTKTNTRGRDRLSARTRPTRSRSHRRETPATGRQFSLGGFVVTKGEYDGHVIGVIVTAICRTSEGR